MPVEKSMIEDYKINLNTHLFPGIIQPILSKQALAPLSRLSFGAFLIHGAVQLYLTGSMRTPEYIFFPKLVSLQAWIFTTTTNTAVNRFRMTRSFKV